MGNVLSIVPTRTGSATDNVIDESETMKAASDNESNGNNEESHDTEDWEENTRTKAREEAMKQFNNELNIKREQRKAILARHRTEKEHLETSLSQEKNNSQELRRKNKILLELLQKNNVEIPEELNYNEGDSTINEAIASMREEVEKLKVNNMKLKMDLAECHRALQGAYSDIADLNSQNTESFKTIKALKEVIRVSKTMVGLREQQLQELKNKLSEIEQSLADREANMLSLDLRQEYERQLQNIRTLRGLYEERARLAEVTRQGLLRELEEQKAFNEIEVKKSDDLKNKVESLELEIINLKEEIESKNNQINSCQCESRGLKAEMSAVNTLFSQVLLGYKNKKDLDILVRRLEEHHGLLRQMAGKENDFEASSALPKLLLELVTQVDENDESPENHASPNEDGSDNITYKNNEISEGEQNTSTTPAEIVENLPRVWRVLMELLSHQVVTENNSTQKVTTCYKSVDTKSGPVLVPSVSQTYIRLKDLIVEKLALIKEVNKMKQLNTHLECRLEEQEKRLCLVTTELSKTWHVVGRLRRHHHQLHTHEKILKYELQQKRKLLNELKEELEYCREKWEQAREKNTQSEKDWKNLRAEFSSRKIKNECPSFNNSAESGYSDERQSDDTSDSNDESEYLDERLVRCKKKNKKSIETVVDSSTDVNIAEREDPASDMIDVAELPLDTQEVSLSELSVNNCIHKGETQCEETEDEIGEIGNDLCLEDSNVTDNSNIVIGNRESSISTNLQAECNSNENLASKIDNLHENHILMNTNQSSISEESNFTCAEDIINEGRVLGTQTFDSDIKEPGNITCNDEKSTTIQSDCSQVGDEHLKTSENVAIKKTFTSKDIELSCSKTFKTHLDIDSKAILENIKMQNERLARKDHRLKSLEENCSDIVNNLAKTLNTGQILEQKMENLHNKYQRGCDEESSNDSNVVDETKSSDEHLESSTNVSTIEEQALRHVEPSCSKTLDSTPHIEIDAKAILENIKTQNDRLAKKDERLKSLEDNCRDVIDNLSKTLNTGDELEQKMDTIHQRQTECNEEATDTNIVDSASDESMASTSSGDVDHEARFAARELRLKRLEEQTKSLVKKVNNTKSKGVRINYKLEELHNIYGSENSRAGTPSESTGDVTEDEDDASKSSTE